MKPLLRVALRVLSDTADVFIDLQYCSNSYADQTSVPRRGASLADQQELVYSNSVHFFFETNDRKGIDLSHPRMIFPRHSQTVTQRLLNTKKETSFKKHVIPPEAFEKELQIKFFFHSFWSFYYNIS